MLTGVLLFMTSSARQDFLSDVLSKEAIPPGKLTYFQTRLASIVHQAMLTVFGRLESQKSFMRRDLALRIGRKPEQITRWLSYPGNLTLSTVSDIFAGMGYEVESVTLKDLATGTRLQCPNHAVAAAGRTISAGRRASSRAGDSTPNIAERSVCKPSGAGSADGCKTDGATHP